MIDTMANPPQRDVEDDQLPPVDSWLDGFLNMSTAVNALRSKGVKLGVIAPGSTIDRSEEDEEEDKEESDQSESDGDGSEASDEEPAEGKAKRQKRELSEQEIARRYKALRKHLHTLHTAGNFCTGGELKWSAPTVADSDDDDGDGQKVDIGAYSLQVTSDVNRDDTATFQPINQLSGEAVAAVCKPAPYGDISKQATVLDPNVRVASEAFFRFRCGNFYKEMPGLETIRQLVEAGLVRDRWSVTLTPYKLNVYGQGGFFKEHVDTPTDSETFLGTVVVCLPSAHKGGELVVTHGKASRVFDFAAKSGDSDCLQWAALFGDCLHEVKPVTEGHRITLTYGIHSGHAQAKPQKKALYDCLTGEGWECDLLNVSYRDYYTKCDSELGYGFDNEQEEQVFAFTAKDCAFLAGVSSKKPEYKFADKVHFLWVSGATGVQVREERDGGGHQGNHYEPASCDTLYLQAALIVKRPKAVDAAGAPEN